ncbi:hypothetical protein [Janthinobacterium aquaticum]|uniref:hypothetical protein n=1 Tax=Janthinobacterium sp. FT58W TaxID=2654254 RepID=UPI001265169D|nr:hypothetical protein [Janthinobacterium sp. FT58W]KAB8042027.1 hypothetical protein GCM43_15395 [Janthinobacterium sp. FT58W]
MLNWTNLTLQQKLISVLGIALCLCVILALFRFTPPDRTPPIGLWLMAIGWLLHPGAFIKGKRTVAWRGAPLLVKIVWAGGITALLVSVTAGVGRMLA